MQEFLDLRTLSINNILMSASFAACLLVYASYNSKFGGTKHIAYAFLLSGCAFLLIGFRGYIPDAISIILSNSLLVLSVACIHLGFIYFYQFEPHKIRQFHGILILLMILLACIFTYIEDNVNARIILVSIFLSMQCIHISKTLLSAHNKANITLSIGYILFALFFLARAVLTFFEEPLSDFMKAGFLHSLSIIVFELLVAVTAFGFVWTVNQKVQMILSDQASHDPLTKALNRRALEEIVNTELSRSLRNRLPLSIMMLDLDYFKHVNDTYGHGQGDSVLVQVAELLMRNTRQYDSIARIGGEEFIILLPETTIDQANVMAENLRVKIAEHNYSSQENNNGIKVTASFGITGLDLEKDSWLHMLERADKGLYKAKTSGRNRVVMYNANNQDADSLSAR